MFFSNLVSKEFDPPKPGMPALYELIEDALKVSPEFQSKMNYWVNQRKKTPETKWIISQLVEIYGIKTVTKKLVG